MSSIDQRFDRYADIFDNPVTAESIELGNRVLHWSFMENEAGGSVAQAVIKHHATWRLPVFITGAHGRVTAMTFRR